MPSKIFFYYTFHYVANHVFYISVNVTVSCYMIRHECCSKIIDFTTASSFLSLYLFSFLAHSPSFFSFFFLLLLSSTLFFKSRLQQHTSRQYNCILRIRMLRYCNALKNTNEKYICIIIFHVSNRDIYDIMN